MAKKTQDPATAPAVQKKTPKPSARAVREALYLKITDPIARVHHLLFVERGELQTRNREIETELATALHYDGWGLRWRTGERGAGEAAGYAAAGGVNEKTKRAFQTQSERGYRDYTPRDEVTLATIVPTLLDREHLAKLRKNKTHIYDITLHDGKNKVGLSPRRAWDDSNVWGSLDDVCEALHCVTHRKPTKKARRLLAEAVANEERLSTLRECIRASYVDEAIEKGIRYVLNAATGAAKRAQAQALFDHTVDSLVADLDFTDEAQSFLAVDFTPTTAPTETQEA